MMRPEAPQFDVYSDPDEDPTIPMPTMTSVGRDLARRIQEYERAGGNVDIDELLAVVKREHAA